MTNFLSNKVIYTGFYLSVMVNEVFLKNRTNNSSQNCMANRFLRFNNKQVEKFFLEKKPKKIAILLPHCIQNYECGVKITSHIDNCKKCGKCKIGDILHLKEKYDLEAKVATGGTLARLFIKEKRPELIIAVACRRDLISGIYDSFPAKVYGIYNEIKKSPCINTNLDIDLLEEVIKKFKGI